MSAKTRSKLTLERVLGMTACSNANVSVNNVTGDVAYPAGCVVVIYNVQKDRQVRYYRVEKAVSAIAFSADGKLLAIAEKGHAPSITIWDVGTGQLKAELKRHKYGVVALAFSENARFLLSMGLVHDKMLYGWDLATNALVGGAFIEDKIHAIAFSTEMHAFVTVGHRHVKFWPIDEAFRTTGRLVNEDVEELLSIPATMSRLTESTFVDVGCAAKTIAVTSDGYLCCFGGTTMERLVSLEASNGFALTVSTDTVAVAGSAATIRLFDAISLEYKQTMPFPPRFGFFNEPNQFDGTRITPGNPDVFPAAMAVRFCGSSLVSLYSDRSLIVFDLPSGQPSRTNFYHNGAVRDLQVVGSVVGLDGRQRIQVTKTRNGPPEGTFVTCGDDNTVRFWHLDRRKKASEGSDTIQPWTNPYSLELLHVLYSDDPSPRPPPGLSDTVIDIHYPKETHEVPDGFKCMAISDQVLAVGTNDGAIQFAQLTWPLLQRCVIPKAHSSSVLSMEFSPTTQNLATGGRDRLTHVFGPVHDTQKPPVCLKTLENHSGAVQTVRFTSDGKRLISAGADHNLVFTQMSDHRIFRYNSFPVKGGKIHSMAIVDNDYVVTCVNASVEIHTLISNKHVQTFAVGEHHNIELSPGAALMALSGSTHDKAIYVVDFHSGEVLAKAAGHGDVITALKFTLDGRRLVSASNDGCIFAWRLSDDLQNALKSKVPPIQSNPIVEAPPIPPAPQVDRKQAASEPPQPPPLMPPPAPPSLPRQKPEEKAQAWQDNARAPIPGPLAQIELEEWMKTRNVPRFEPTIEHVPPTDVPQPSRAQPESNDSVLNKDLVPSWARTVKPTILPDKDEEMTPVVRGKWAESAPPTPFVEPMKNQTEVQTDEKETRVAECEVPVPEKVLEPKLSSPNKRNKWKQFDGEVAESIAMCDDLEDQDDDDDVSETLYIKQSNGELHELQVPTSSSSSNNNSVKPAGVSSSWSLAHERDLLQKKKKQQETANAVADMQMKLGQLGILKPKSKPKDTDAKVKQVDVKSSVASSIDQTPVDISLSHYIAGFDKASPGESVDLTPVDQSLSQFIDGHSQHASKFCQQAPNTPSLTSSTDSVLAVDVSLSNFVSGHVHTPKDAEQQVVRRADDVQTRISTGSLDFTPVDLSLSNFTSGYADNTITKKNGISAENPAASVDLTPVDVSLSNFTGGYNQVEKPLPDSSPSTDTGRGKVPLVAASIDLTPVDQSLSNFTSGFASQAVQGSIDVPVDKSLSCFVTGYKNTNTSVSASNDSPLQVDISLSHFVSGYSDTGTPKNANHTATSVSVDLTPLDQSLGKFVSGYDTPAPQHSIDLTPVDASLSQFVHGYQNELADNGKRLAPEDESSSTDGDVDDVASSGSDPSDAVNLSQYISGYRGSVDISPVDAPKIVAENVAAPEDSASDSSSSSKQKDEAVEDSVEYVPGELESKRTDIKVTVRSLRLLEVNLETTVRQLEDIRPGQDTAVDEILALASQLQSKIAEYTERVEDHSA